MSAPMSTHVSNLSKEIKLLLKENKALTFDDNNRKICCSLSGHEMPCTAAAIRTYIQGKKYRKLAQGAHYDHSEYLQHIVPSTKKGLDHLLFCKLTLRHINDSPGDVEVHVKGRRFQKELARWKKCKETGETFKPLSSSQRKGPAWAWDRMHKKGRKGDNPDSDEEEEDGNQSDLSDLYPESDFASSEDEELNGEMENLNTEERKVGSENAARTSESDSASDTEMAIDSSQQNISAKVSKTSALQESENQQFVTRKRNSIDALRKREVVPRKKKKQTR